jgi:hypothetical protein
MTAKDLILQADEPYRTQMFQNAHPVTVLCKYTTLSHCLPYLFDWEVSPQGRKYWSNYEKHLIKQGL